MGSYLPPTLLVAKVKIGSLAISTDDVGFHENPTFRAFL